MRNFFFFIHVIFSLAGWREEAFLWLNQMTLCFFFGKVLFMRSDQFQYKNKFQFWPMKENARTTCVCTHTFGLKFHRRKRQEKMGHECQLKFLLQWKKCNCMKKKKCVNGQNWMICECEWHGHGHILSMALKIKLNMTLALGVIFLIKMNEWQFFGFD